MSARTVPIWRVVVRLVANAPLRYTASALAWISIWTMPLAVGLIAATFFDGLAGEAGWNVPTLVAAIWAYVVVRIGFVLLAMRLHSSLLFRAASGMRRSMLRWLYTLPGAQPVAETPGEVVSRFRDDVTHTVEAYDFTVDLIGSIVSTAIAVIILVTIDPMITAIVFTPIVVVIAVTSRLGTRIRRYRRDARDATEAITGFLGETLSAVQSVKVADAERPMLGHFVELNDRRRTMMVRDRTFTAGIEAVFYNTVSIGTGLILILAVDALGTGDSAGLSIGEFSLFVYLLQLVTESAWFIGTFLARLRQAEVSVQRKVALMRGANWQDLTTDVGLESSIAVPELRLPKPDETAALVSVRDLSYRYPSSGKGIEDIELDIPTGEFVVVTGKIGSGKTTLLRAILGLVPADTGEIRWKGAVVDHPGSFMVPPRAAYTPQTPRLFSMSLRDNLLLGHRADDDALLRSVETATMTRDVASMSDGFDTLVGPRGVRLSGGQVQRSAAARMLVRNPELLVFDDLSSALDVETEAELWEGLFSREEATTVLAVSHRRPAFKRAGRVVVMDYGRIAAMGKAEELLEASPIFREMWSDD
ncbi:MAG TPA: ABC transporter ATP-binding protein [Acidimicrobiia bacterium]|nr:ABC transporter ATP-binding protein [Acidimicrobiia bacterium]